MKRILLELILLVFFFLSPKFSFAQTVTIPMPTTSLTPSPEPTIVNYELPYPGILPGSPLYALKSFRDKFQELMTSGSLKKSNYYLLQADKRLAASVMLYKQGNPKLGEETLSKSLNYLDKTFEEMIKSKKSNENVGDIYSKIQNSSSKQIEQIEILLKTEKGESAQKLKEDLKSAREISNRAESFKP